MYVNDNIMCMQFYTLVDSIQGLTRRQKTGPVYTLLKKRALGY